MISKFFVRGTTYNWNPPPAVTPARDQQDGAIFSSGNLAPPALTYAGLHGNLSYGEGKGPFRAMWAKMHSPQSLGLIANYNLPYQWLNYVHGKTAYLQQAGGDILTGFMSGCWIVTFTQGGNRRVGHIGTVESAPKNQPPNTTVKQTFRNQFVGANPAATNLTGFNPAAAWSFNEMLDVMKDVDPAHYGQYVPNLVALVTRNNHFYSILMITKAPNTLWICGGAKRVSGSSQATVLAALA